MAVEGDLTAEQFEACNNHSVTKEVDWSVKSWGNHVTCCYIDDEAEAWLKKPSVLQEVWQMCELKHENIVPFFGVCTEPPNICIVTQYCNKGSLKGQEEQTTWLKGKDGFTVPPPEFTEEEEVPEVL
ncbi:hypothetical protein ACRRTK_011975 [Alexandromys fortis]